jgi:hypothetical protein
MAAQSPTDIWGLPGIQLDELTSNAMVTGNIVISSFTGPRRPATPTASTAGQDPMGFNCPIQGDLYWLCASGDLVFECNDQRVQKPRQRGSPALRPELRDHDRQSGLPITPRLPAHRRG